MIVRASDFDNECHVGVISHTEPTSERFSQSFGHHKCFFVGAHSFVDESDGEEGGARGMVEHDL